MTLNFDFSAVSQASPELHPAIQQLHILIECWTIYTKYATVVSQQFCYIHPNLSNFANAFLSLGLF